MTCSILTSSGLKLDEPAQASLSASLVHRLAQCGSSKALFAHAVFTHAGKSPAECSAAAHSERRQRHSLCFRQAENAQTSVRSSPAVTSAGSHDARSAPADDRCWPSGHCTDICAPQRLRLFRLWTDRSTAASRDSGKRFAHRRRDTSRAEIRGRRCAGAQPQPLLPKQFLPESLP